MMVPYGLRHYIGCTIDEVPTELREWAKMVIRAQNRRILKK